MSGARAPVSVKSQSQTRAAERPGGGGQTGAMNAWTSESRSNAT